MEFARILHRAGIQDSSNVTSGVADKRVSIDVWYVQNLGYLLNTDCGIVLYNFLISPSVRVRIMERWYHVRTQRWKGYQQGKTR